jgi:hypothetical protein
MRISRSDVIEVSTSMCRSFLLKSLTTLNMQKRLPQALASLMKSTAHAVSRL